MNSCRVAAKYSDVVFIINKTRYSAHRSLFSMLSETFADKLKNFPEDKKKVLRSGPASVILEDLDEETFDVILKFVYQHEVCIKSVALAFKIVDAAIAYNLEYLKYVALNYVRQHLTLEDFWAIIEGGGDIPEYFLICKDFLTLHSAEILKCEKIDLIPEVLCSVLFSSSCDSEIDKLNAIGRWLMSHNKFEDYIQNRSFLSNTNFDRITATDFIIFTHTYPLIISDHDSIQILHFISGLTILPEWLEKTIH